MKKTDHATEYGSTDKTKFCKLNFFLTYRPSITNYHSFRAGL